MIKFVVAKSIVPKHNGEEGTEPLTVGKRYKVEHIYIDGRMPDINPYNPKFYIIVIDDYGDSHSLWNDYFYSTEEMRELELDKILNE